MTGDNETPAWITATQGAANLATPAPSTDIPSTTLDDVNVTAKAPTTPNNPTASPVPVAQQQQPAGGDDLTLTIGNRTWDGWQRVSLTRSLEHVPASFDLQVTERYPNSSDIDIKPGDACEVKIGGDLVLTGFIDRYEYILSPGEHVVHVAGRSKSQDLVDCAAFVGGQSPSAEQYLLSGTAVGIIQQLAKAYGVSVATEAGEGPQVPNFSINLGETAWEIIDRMSKIAGVVVYDMPDGSLMVATAGEDQMASGFQQGVNVETAQTQFTMDQRFSVYEGFYLSTAQLQSDSGGTSPPDQANIAYDNGARSFRKRIIISNQSDANGALLPRLVKWEEARRAGRSQAVTVMCDSWRDTSNNLWAPNHLATVDIPAVKIPSVTWCIGMVTYMKDERGRHALVMLMPKDAFLPEPTANIGSYPMASDMGYTDQNSPNNPTAGGSNTPPPPAPGQPTGEMSVGGAIPNRIAEQASTSAPTTPQDIVSP